jgi:hypothetical protein
MIVRRHTTNGRRAAPQQERVTAQKSARTSAQTSHLTKRLASIEQVLHAQQQRIAEQEQELRDLRAALAASAAEAIDAAGATAPASRLKPQSAGMQTSRRALLMAGGTVAAVAAIEVATSHAPVAQARGASASHASNASRAEAGGVAWLTGTVNADEETLVKPSGVGYTSNDVLQVQIGTGTVYSPAPLKAAITAYDTTSNNIGLYATSSTGYGLYGVTDSGNGATGAGLSGTANTGVGVAGMSAAGIAVSGNSTSGLGAMFSGGQAPLALALSGRAGPPPMGNHIAGEIFADAYGEVWICKANGTPGSWYQVAHLASGVNGGGVVNYLATPIRLLDTRPGQPAATRPGVPYLAGSTNTVQVSDVNYNGVQVPGVCAGAVGNLTVIGRSGGGNYVELVPHSAGFSGTSNLNFVAGQLVSNFYNVGLGANGYLDIILGSGGNADVILDLYAVIA